MNVERYLDDLQENVDKLAERFTPQYAASAEATTVLRQASDIQRYMSTLPPNFDGASEWNRLSASLGELAANYGTTQPLPEGQATLTSRNRSVRRRTSDRVGSPGPGVDAGFGPSEPRTKPPARATARSVEVTRRRVVIGILQ